MSAATPRIGYVPYADHLQRPGDRRRFPRYAALRDLPFEIARKGGRYDIVVLSARADITRWAHADRRYRLIYDLIDPYLEASWGIKHALRGAAKWAARETSRFALIYQEAVRAMVRRSDAVVCSTEEQRQLIVGLNENTHVVLDFHGEFGSPELPPPVVDERFHIVWEGLPATLPAVAPLLAGLQGGGPRRPVTLHVITDLSWPRYLDRFMPRRTEGIVRRWPVPVVLYQWHLRTMPSITRACDVAIVPLNLDDPFSRGKPENRLRIFWRLGLPVLASASPAHQRAVERAGLDKEMLCADPADWARMLRRYAERPPDTEVLERGRRSALDDYGDHAIAEAWDQVFRSIA